MKENGKSGDEVLLYHELHPDMKVAEIRRLLPPMLGLTSYFVGNARCHLEKEQVCTVIWGNLLLFEFHLISNSLKDINERINHTDLPHLTVQRYTYFEIPSTG